MLSLPCYYQSMVIQTSTKREETRALNVRLPVSIYALLAATADKEARSVTQQVLYIIRKEYETREVPEPVRE